MSEEHTVYYGAHRVCEACDSDFSSFDEYRKVVIESDDDNFPGRHYFLCPECTDRVLKPVEGESPGMRELSQ